MIIKTQTANAVNAQCYRKEEEVDWRSWCPKRGEIYLCQLGNEGLLYSEIKGYRPVLIASNDIANRHSPVVTIIPLTSSQIKNNLPVHVKVGVEEGLRNLSLICCEQTKTVSKNRMFINGSLVKICKLSNELMCKVDNALKIQFGLV